MIETSTMNPTLILEAAKDGALKERSEKETIKVKAKRMKHLINDLFI
jgi:hypothetical protein